jgi:hypothetical protein
MDSFEASSSGTSPTERFVCSQIGVQKELASGLYRNSDELFEQAARRFLDERHHGESQLEALRRIGQAVDWTGLCERVLAPTSRFTFPNSWRKVRVRFIMSSQFVTPEGEAGIWARLMDSQPTELTPDAARCLLVLSFDEQDQARVQALAEQSQEGLLDEDDAREFDSYLHIANLLSVIQSKARLALDRQAAT